MNTFSNMEINDLLSNRFRLEDRHTPNYLAECFQRLFPTLGRVGLSTVIDEMARANHRAFNSSKLPIRGETLDLNFFFELWKRNFRFEGGIYDKFTFSDELKLAFRINPREFWEVLIRADREMGTYLKDCFELLKYHTLPQAISLNLRPNGSSVDDKTIRLIRDKLPHSMPASAIRGYADTSVSMPRDNVTTHEIAKICLQLFEVANPADYDIRRLAEELEKENGIRRLNGSASAIRGYAGTSVSMPREPFAIIPKKVLDRLSTKCVLEFFKNKPLTSSEASAMERGVYIITEADILLANNQGSDSFWLSIIPDKKERENTLSARNCAGMGNEARNFKQGENILVVTDRSIREELLKNRKDVILVQQMGARVGINPSFIEDFMGKIYVCHSFYDLKDLKIDYQTLRTLKEMMEV